MTPADHECYDRMQRAWPPGTVAQLEPGHDFPGKGPSEWRNVIVVDRCGEIGVMVNDLLVHDGEIETWVAPKWLRRLEVTPELGPRMVAHVHA